MWAWLKHWWWLQRHPIDCVNCGKLLLDAPAGAEVCSPECAQDWAELAQW